MFILLSQSDEDYNQSGEESGECNNLPSSNVFLKKNNKLKKKGRKCQWSEPLVINLAYIIVENYKYMETLLMTDTKNAKNGQYMDCIIKELKDKCVDQGKEFLFDMNQTRQKFRRCVVACRAVTLKIKISYRTKRFQKSKDYGE